MSGICARTSVEGIYYDSSKSEGCLESVLKKFIGELKFMPSKYTIKQKLNIIM